MGRPRRGSAALAGTVLFMLLSGAGTAAAADDVVPVPETGGEGMLRLTSSVYPLDLPLLSGGQSFSWQVGVVLDGPTSASATVQLQAAGSLAAGPGAYRITARSCPVQWLGTSGKNARMSCPAGERRVLSADSFSAAGTFSYPLGNFTTTDAPWVLFTLEHPGSAGLEPGPGSGTLKFGIGVVAGGDESSTSPLAETGAQILSYIGAGIVLVAAGAGVLLARRRRFL
jgi:LPXTG-motif cell wall-anchored protein